MVQEEVHNATDVKWDMQSPGQGSKEGLNGKLGRRGMWVEMVCLNALMRWNKRTFDSWHKRAVSVMPFA